MGDAEQFDDPRSAAAQRARDIERLFRDHNESLVSFLALRLRSRQEAREVAQETYVRMLQLERPGVALYDMSYRKLQVSFFMPDNPVNTETVNTDRPAGIRGLELDYAIALGSRLRLGGTYAWTDVGIPPQLNPFTGEETWLAPVYSPRHAATLELDYDAGRLASGRLALHADANYATGQFTYNSDLQRSRPTALANLRATLDDLDFEGTRLALSLWVRNLFDRPYELAGIGGAVGPMAVFGEARSFGVDATMTFGR